MIVANILDASPTCDAPTRCASGQTSCKSLFPTRVELSLGLQKLLDFREHLHLLPIRYIADKAASELNSVVQMVAVNEAGHVYVSDGRLFQSDLNHEHAIIPEGIFLTMKDTFEK